MTAVPGTIAQERNPSLPLALAAVLQVADTDGRVVFAELALAYRERYRHVGRRSEGVGQGGTLSVAPQHSLTS